MFEAAAQQELQVLVFEIAGQRYALPATDVREIVRVVTVSSLPGTPAIVEGVIDVRGTLVPVLDIRSRFRLAPKPLEHTDHLVLAWAGPRAVALRADRALALVRLDASRIEDPRAAVPGVEHVSGVARLDDGIVLIHDLRGFLLEAEAEALDQAIGQTIGQAIAHDGDLGDPG